MHAGDAAHGHARDAVLDGRSVSGAPIRARRRPPGTRPERARSASVAGRQHAGQRL